MGIENASSAAAAWLKQEAAKDRNRVMPALRRGVRDEFGHDVTDEPAKDTEKRGKAVALRHAREYLSQYERPQGLTDAQVITEIMRATRTMHWRIAADRYSKAIWQEAMNSQDLM